MVHFSLNWTNQDAPKQCKIMELSTLLNLIHKQQTLTFFHSTEVSRMYRSNDNDVVPVTTKTFSPYLR